MAYGNKNGNRNNGKTKNNEQEVVKPENKAVAFIHWEALSKTGEVILKDDKGIALFQNPKYPSDAEDRLIEMAELQGDDVITFNCRMTVRLNKKKYIAKAADELLAELF